MEDTADTSEFLLPKKDELIPTHSNRRVNLIRKARQDRAANRIAQEMVSTGGTFQGMSVQQYADQYVSALRTGEHYQVVNDMFANFLTVHKASGIADPVNFVPRSTILRNA